MGFFDTLFGDDAIEARKPRFAGDLYPAQAEALKQKLSALLDGAAASPSAEVCAVIVPHARLDVVGELIAEAYASVSDDDQVDRVVVIGSSRLVPFRGLALDAWDGFETPLGVLRYPDAEVLGTPPDGLEVRRMAAAFDPEESIEAQLPFVRHRFGEVELAALLVGDASSDQVHRALDWLADDRSLVVASANLSHDVPLDRARELDEASVQFVEGLHPEHIGREHTTGRVALQGLLKWGTSRGCSARCLARSNSYEQGGGAETVVGYGAFCFEEGRDD